MLCHLIVSCHSSGVAPFPGAETGTGGRLRDVQATGRGAHTLAGVSAYCVGNLNIPGHTLPWEQPEIPYATNLAKPLDIMVEASNGASDYGKQLVCRFYNHDLFAAHCIVTFWIYTLGLITITTITTANRLST
jgi:phosphoribosylformylglycinamidine (FGAM) synthase-like enzyme